MEKSKVEGLLGLCKKAGRMIVGTDLAVAAIRQNSEVLLLLIAKDASDNAKKRALNTCASHGVRAETLDLDTEQLGHIVKKGSCVAAVGICDKGFADAILREMKG